MHPLTPLLLVLLLALTPVLAMAQAGDADEASIKLLSIDSQTQSTAAKALLGCKPEEEKTTGAINKNGVYTLTGDLFHTGRTLALVDAGGVTLCEWKNQAWTPLFAINITPQWNWPKDYRDYVGRSPDNQTCPFWTLDLHGRSLLVIAAQVEKAGQYYYVILLDAKCERILSIDSSFQQRPEVKSGYLITGDASRNKAEWGATYYSQIKNDGFIELKSWEDSQPWHSVDREDQPDDSSNYASADGKGYIILPGTSNDPHPADYLIYGSDPKLEGDKRFDTTGKPFASIYFSPSRNTESGGGYSHVPLRKTNWITERAVPRLRKLSTQWEIRSPMESKSHGQ